MSVLDLIVKPKLLAPRITVYGLPGIGKSTFASTFPKPLFLLTEQCGLQDINVINPVKNFEEFYVIIKQLVMLENPPFETLVIDSISKLDQLIVEYILNKEPEPINKAKAKNLATALGGYGAGYQAAQQLHRQVKGVLDGLQQKGITVVYIGHVATTKYKAPDSEDYDRYSIVMNGDKSREVYIDDVDCVAFCKLMSVNQETKSGRNIRISSDDRILLPSISETYVGKNRFNMPVQMPMNFNEFAKHIPFFNKGEK